MHKWWFVVLLLPGLLFAQEAEKEDVWAPLRPLVGTWEGTGEGSSGKSKIEAQFGFVLNDQFIEVRHKAAFEPQEQNPAGEVHEDRGFISYDRMRKKFVFRQFHVEGFINQYVLDSLSADGKTLVFDSEALENAPPGWRARLTYNILGDDEIESVFELAMPGKDFQCYAQNRFRREHKSE